MKLLLTSIGICNDTLDRELESLVGKSKLNIKIGVVCTAGLVEGGSKDVFLDSMNNLRKYGYRWIDIMDISNPNHDWKSRLSQCDVIYVSGGNTFFLMDQCRKVGFDQWLKDNIENHVYVGVSAGSITVGKSVEIATVEPADDNFVGMADFTGMGLVPFNLSPHSPDMVSYESNEEYQKKDGGVLYAYDEQSAVKVEGDSTEIVGGGKIFSL